VIVKVGQKTGKNVADFEDVMKKESLKDGVMLLVRTVSGNRFVVVQRR